MCWFCKNQHKQANQGCTDLGGTIRRRQRAVQIGPHMLRGPAGQLPTRLGHAPCKPGSLETWSWLFCACVPWRLAQEACACMHRPVHGRCITPRTYGPSADAEESTAEPQWATCPARARMRVCTVSSCARRTRSRRRMSRVGGMHNQGVYAFKASPPDVLASGTVSYWFWRSSFEPRRRRAKRTLCAF